MVIFSVNVLRGDPKAASDEAYDEGWIKADTIVALRSAGEILGVLHSKIYTAAGATFIVPAADATQILDWWGAQGGHEWSGDQAVTCG
jgi:hypothetical protein